MSKSCRIFPERTQLIVGDTLRSTDLAMADTSLSESYNKVMKLSYFDGNAYSKKSSVQEQRNEKVYGAKGPAGSFCGCKYIR